MRCEAQINTGKTALQSRNYNVTVDSPPTLKKNLAYSRMLQFLKGGNEDEVDQKYDFMKNFKRGGISHCNQKGHHTLKKSVS